MRPFPHPLFELSLVTWASSRFTQLGTNLRSTPPGVTGGSLSPKGWFTQPQPPLGTRGVSTPELPTVRQPWRTWGAAQVAVRRTPACLLPSQTASHPRNGLCRREPAPASLSDASAAGPVGGLHFRLTASFPGQGTLTCVAGTHCGCRKTAPPLMGTHPTRIINSHEPAEG